MSNYLHQGTPEFVIDYSTAYAVARGLVYWVDYDKGANGNTGRTPKKAFKTIQRAVDRAAAGAVIYILPRTISAGQTDANSYVEVVDIPLAKSNLSLIGVGTGRTQIGLPQIRMGSGSTALLTINAPGCRIANIGFNGYGATGGGILLNDDAGATYTSFGTVIENCHFKNCVGSTATNAATGGAIQWSANGGGWQTLIKGNRFYKNVGDVVLKGTSSSVPQDVVIEDNIFSGPAANVDCNLFLKGGGSGMNGVVIRNNVFQQLPAIDSGSIKRYMDLTGCVGVVANNYFACETNVTGTGITFIAAGTGAYVPLTVHMMGNYGQSITDGETGEIPSGY